MAYTDHFLPWCFLDATAATSAAPRPLPSSDNIRSNWKKTNRKKPIIFRKLSKNLQQSLDWLAPIFFPSLNCGSAGGICIKTRRYLQSPFFRPFYSKGSLCPPRPDGPPSSTPIRRCIARLCSLVQSHVLFLREENVRYVIN